MDEGTASNRPTQDHSSLRLGLAAALPVAIALALAAGDVLRNSGLPRFPCPLYPNAVVAFAAELHESCPLEPGDAILGVEIGGHTEAVGSPAELDARLVGRADAKLVLRRSGEASDRVVPALLASWSMEEAWSQLGASMGLAALLLMFVFLTAIRAGVPAALPFALIHSSVGVLIIAAVAGWSSTRSYPLTALARAVLPAALIHLGFVFPRTREVAIRVPGIHRVAYGIALGLLVLELNSAYRGSFSTMLLLQRIGMAACGCRVHPTLLQLVAQHARVAFETGARAGQGLPPGSGSSPGHPDRRCLDRAARRILDGGDTRRRTLAFAARLCDRRYHLFGFDMTWRRAISHVVYLSIWSGLFFVGVVLMRDRFRFPSGSAIPS